MYEHAFRHVLFPLYEEVIRRRGTYSYLEEYERSQWLQGTDLQRFQLAKLNALLEHCWTNVPFLARYWGDHGLRRGPLGHVTELEGYPVLTKALITQNFTEMRAKASTGPVLTKTTGGSTGEPFRYEYSQESYARRTAVMWRGYRWCGADLGRRSAYVWGAGPPLPGWRGLKDRWYHAAFNRLFLNCFRLLSEADIEEFIRQLNRFRPRVLVGYVAPLMMISRHLTERGMKAHVPETIISAAEALTPPARELITKAFGAPVHDSYGCREFMLIACECSQRKGLHVNVDHLIVETVDGSGRALRGRSGEVCVTDLHNYRMPFVRYLTGDCATYTDRACACGRGLPLFESVDGRLLDVIVSPDGRAVPGEFFVYLMLEFLQIRQYQFVQDAPQELEVRVVPRTTLTQSDRDHLVRKVRECMGSTVRVNINEVAEIPLTRSGKQRVTISRLHEDRKRHALQ